MAEVLHPGLITGYLEATPDSLISRFTSRQHTNTVAISLDTTRRPRRSLAPVQGPDINDTNVREALKLDMFLRQVETLQHLSPPELQHLRKRLQVKIYTDGNTIPVAGEDGSSLFSILYRGKAFACDSTSEICGYLPGDILSKGEQQTRGVTKSAKTLVAKDLCVVLVTPVEMFTTKANQATEAAEISFAGCYLPWHNPVDNVRDRYAQVKAVFRFADDDKNGVISKEELGQLCEHMGIGMDNADLKELFGYIDKTNDGDIELSEFAEWWENMNLFDRLGPTTGDGDDEEEELRRRREAWGLTS